jgi:hypothetical protein
LKDAASVLLVVAAIVYGLGWYMRMQAEATLNVGPLDFNHQAAVAAGISFLILYSPLVTYILWSRFRVKDSQRRGIPLALGIVVVIVYWNYGFTRPLSPGDGFGLIMLVIAANGCLLVGLRQLGVLPSKDKPDWKSTIMLSIIGVGPFFVYGAAILPFMAPWLGGFYNSHATMVMSDGSRQPVTVVDSDDDSVIVRVGELPRDRWVPDPFGSKPPTQLSYRRIYKKEIQSIEFDAAAGH